jgi:hypothetical protein
MENYSVDIFERTEKVARATVNCGLRVMHIADDSRPDIAEKLRAMKPPHLKDGLYHDSSALAAAFSEQLQSECGAEFTAHAGMKTIA